jgi:hypothetical protein
MDRLGFDASCIHVMNYDGSLRAFGDPEGEPVGVWPGDGTPYRMVVNAEGSRSAFRGALDAVGEKLTSKDQLFINTMGHGGHHGSGYAPDLLTFPYSERYNCREFCADLASLPPHGSLVVLMAQCFSGGFNQAIVESSPAASTFVASATSETRQSFMSFTDSNWDSFQRNWLAGLSGRDVDGIPINASIGEQHTRTVLEAFTYAITCSGKNPYDSPEFLSRPCAASEITLRSDALMSSQHAAL